MTTSTSNVAQESEEYCNEYTRVGRGGLIEPAAEPMAAEAWVDEIYLHIKLKDGRIISVPWTWFPRLRNATPEQRAAVEIEHWPDGAGLHWEEIDEDLSVYGLLRSPAPEAM